MVYRPFTYCLMTLRLEEFAENIEANLNITDEVRDTHITLPGGFKLMPGPWEPIVPENEVEVNGRNTKTIWMPVQPVISTHQRNPAMEADTLDCWFDITDFPIDPRVIRANGVAFFAGLYSPEEYEEMALSGGQVPESVFSNRNLRFSGFADEVTLVGDEVHITFRDMTGILIDTKIPSAMYKRMKWGDDTKPVYIEEVIVSILKTLPAFNRVPVVLRGFAPKFYQFSTNIRKKIPTRKKKVAGAPPATPAAGEPKKKAHRTAKIKEETYWDLLTDVAVQNGFVIYCDTRTDDDTIDAVSRVILTRPDTLFNEYTAATGRTLGDTITCYNAETGASWKEPTGKFTTQNILVDGQTYSPEGLMFIHGQNGDVEFNRKYSEEAVASVELVCQDGNKIIRSRYPSDKANPSTVYGSWAVGKVRVYAVSGISDQAALDVAARQTFYALNKAEMEVKIDTTDFTSFAGKEGSADVLDLKAGMPVEVWTAKGSADQIFDPRTDFARMSVTDMKEYLKGRGLDDRQAHALAYGLRNPEGQNLLTKVWFTRTVSFTYDTDSVNVTIEGVNYITPRVSKWEEEGQKA